MSHNGVVPEMAKYLPFPNGFSISRERAEELRAEWRRAQVLWEARTGEYLPRVMEELSREH